MALHINAASSADEVIVVCIVNEKLKSPAVLFQTAVTSLNLLRFLLVIIITKILLSSLIS